MMKRSLVLLLAACLLFCASAGAAKSNPLGDLTSYSDLELVAIRDQINAELGARKKAVELAPASDESLGKIKDLFPDEALAMVIRDKTAKFSIEQTVTQAELDDIEIIQLYSCEHGDFQDLTGIGYLRNLSVFGLYNGMEYKGTSLPEEFYTLTNLSIVQLDDSNLSELSPSLGNLTKLTLLDIEGTDVAVLPDSIGNLTNLSVLNISRTNVATLPDSIGNLTSLENLDIGYTKITSLPDSIWNLSLKELNMAGLPIK